MNSSWNKHSSRTSLPALLCLLNHFNSKIAHSCAMYRRKKFSLKTEWLLLTQILTASKIQVMDGDLFFLVFRAFLTAVRPSLLSMLGNIETTSHETSRVPAGKRPLLLRSSNLLSRSVVSLINDGNLRASGCK